MRLVWHIVQKDVRRLALPMAAWLAMIVIPTVAFRLASPTVEGHVASSIGTSVAAASIWIRLLVAIQLVIGYVLAGVLVLEDSLVETNAFWMTRPIANRRLLAAKVLAATLLFVVAPVLALAPVWFASGFSLLETWLAGCEFAKWQGAATLLALSIASLSRNLAQLIFLTIPFLGVDFVSVWLTSLFFQDASVPVRLSRVFLAHAGMLLVAAFVLAQQFLTRRIARAWVTIALAFVVGLVIRAAWPWDIWSGIAAGTRATRLEERPEDRSAEIVAALTFTSLRNATHAVPSFFITAPWTRDRLYVPVFAKLSDGTIAPGASGAGASEAGLRALGFKNDEGPLLWHVDAPPRVLKSAAEPNFTGTLEVWAVRPRVLGEMPLRVGARIADGANRTRILELGVHEDRLDEIFIEERDAHSASLGGWNSNRSAQDFESLRYIDRYFLVNRATRKAQTAHVSDLGSVEWNSLVIRFGRLGVSGSDDWRDGVLIKLRFECDHRFERPLDMRGVTTPPPTKQP